MQVSKWGDGLGVRLPATVVETLGLKDGDEVEIRAVGQRTLEIAPVVDRARALEIIRSLRRPLPPDWSFDREEANAR
ncbi:MAG: AbrB/MazE/SpoVT family DNA-binding domain-containing protein [Candidatus Competibacteraceae bacterium]|nr:AbrB/MazE/SpoVT family DNA-binding domain-containing protein [Candidatus Competibacteraceae bacterium]